jgi:prepilin signal peptidase PulO-like enzyme (type II secretory pathway)
MDAGLLPTAQLAAAHRLHHTGWPLVVLSVAADATLCTLLLLKLWAYGIEGWWMFGSGGQRLRNSYMYSYHHDKLPRRYEDDIACGRPRPFTRGPDTDSAKMSPATVFGYIFKAPSLVLISAIVSLAVGTWAPAALGIATACLITMLVLFILAASLLGRLIMGPFDQLNPDLGVGEAAEQRFYPSSSPLGRYVLAMIVLNIVGFTATYANIAHAVAGAFTSNQSIDPIRWLYFTSTIASTVGFGDIHAASDVGRLFVLMQLFAGSLLLTWIAAVFLGESLPVKDPEWQPAPQQYGLTGCADRDS